MSRRIPDPVGLIAGIAFTGIGLAFLVGEVELANRARWVWPIALFSVGAGILAAVLGRPSEQAVDATGATAAGAGLSTDLSGPAAGAGTPEPWHEPGTAAQERPGTAPGSVVDGEAAAADEPEAAPSPGAEAEPSPGAGAAPSSGADEDATEERDQRQAGGPPA
jgi:hypothetical protein